MLLLEANIPNVVFCHVLDYRDYLHNLFVPSHVLYVQGSGRELSKQTTSFFFMNKDTYPFDRKISCKDPE